MTWLLQTDKPGKFDAEVGYVTGGFTWQADYNLVSPEKGDDVDLVGWITLKNDSGKTFENAKIKLMAGDVNKIQPPMAARMHGSRRRVEERWCRCSRRHGKSLRRISSLRHRAGPRRSTTARPNRLNSFTPKGSFAPTIYVYDGASDYRFYGGLNTSQGYGTSGNKKVVGHARVRQRRYQSSGRRAAQGQTALLPARYGRTSCNLSAKTRLTTRPGRKPSAWPPATPSTWWASARRPISGWTRARSGSTRRFEIKLRNRKKEPVEIRVVEHLYRWSSWDITAKSDAFKKTDAQTIEFRVPVKPDEEKTITYTVHYSW